MDRNIGERERRARAVVAPLAVYVGMKAGPGHRVRKLLAFAAAGEVLATSITGYSPLYAALGLSTRNDEGEDLSIS